MLALLLGAGVRRSEVCRLTFSDIQEREGRWVIADLLGKHGRIRTVPIPAWTRFAVDAWAKAVGLTEGQVFRPLDKAGHVVGEKLSCQSIFQVVREYADQCGIKAAPHDIRRTFARLAHKGHAALDQIQLSLGHASLTTTERYLGVRLELHDAPCDHLGLHFAMDQGQASPDAVGGRETSALVAGGSATDTGAE